MEGVIYVIGNDPYPVLALRDDRGDTYQVAGPWADELRRLAGARVSVTGSADSATYPPAIQVTEYTLLEMDGHRPWIGDLSVGPGGLWLLAPDSLALEDPTGRLQALAGAKVWVIADTTTRPALVQSFGLLRPAPP